MSQPQLGKGSVVWAKLPAFPWWPAKVQEISGSDIYVAFLGTQDLGTVTRDNTVPYTSKLSLREAKQKDRWENKFKQAIEEANCHAGLAPDAAPDAQGETTSHHDPQVVEAEEAAEEVAEDTQEADEKALVLDAKKVKAKAEDSSDEEGVGPSKGLGQSKGSSKRQLPADSGLPGWCDPLVGKVPARSLWRGYPEPQPACEEGASSLARACPAQRPNLTVAPRTVCGPDVAGWNRAAGSDSCHALRPVTCGRDVWPVTRDAQADTRASERERAQVEDVPRAKRRDDQVARDRAR